jgi:hypothetical protein
MTPYTCSRCKNEVREEDARSDQAGRVYHQMCYEIAYPGAQKQGLVISGVDIPFIDLTVLVLKLTMASLLVGGVLGLFWATFRLFLRPS